VLTRLPARLAAGSDATAILVFVTIGLLSHHGDLTVRGYARDLVPFLGCWFAAGISVRLYKRPSIARLAATWAIGVSAAVLVRALALGRTLGSKEAAFLTVSLVTIGALVALFRAILTPLAARLARS
jgi:Protein of unknown function (DUF3054)